MKPQSIHRHLVDQVALALTEIFRDQKYADKTIEKMHKAHRKWGSRDRRFFAEQVYECVRWWRKYWFLLDEEPNFENRSLVRLWGIHQLSQGQPLPEWSELRDLEISQAKLTSLQSQRAIRESIPDWLDEQGAHEMGMRWNSILTSLNQASSVDLRVNTLKAQRQQVLSELSKEGVEVRAIEDSDIGITLLQRKNVFITESYLKGHFEMQDRASQLVAPFLRAEPGMRVVDACAGAGGKSLHIAALMKNKGKVISMDIHEWKLDELRKRATRNGVDIIETKWIENSKVIKRFDKTADRLLLDVPCSGIGVLRRGPDTKWKLSPERLAELHQLQAEILSDYSKMTKVGGMMVYATCSFFPSENEKRIEAFLQNEPGWELQEQVRIDPDQGRGDGFFAARLIRRA